jgi:hypothetical protein
MSEVQEAPAPKLLHKGVYSAYETPDGGIHIAFLREGNAEEHTEHMEFPGQLLKLAEMASEGKLTPGQMMKTMGGMFKRGK